MLNSAEAAKDLLDKRGLIYSDRPYFPTYGMNVTLVLLVCTINSFLHLYRIGWEYLIVFVRYGEQFHKMRKLFQEALSRTGVLVFQDIQQHQAHVLLKNLLRSPDQFSDHVKRCDSSFRESVDILTHSLRFQVCKRSNIGNRVWS